MRIFEAIATCSYTAYNFLLQVVCVLTERYSFASEREDHRR